MKDYVDIAIKYARRAVRDRENKRHCELTRLAAKRFLNDLKKAKRKRNSFYFDPDQANNPCDFIEKMPHVEGNWDSPTIVLADCWVFCVVNIFGFRRRSDGLRRFSTVYIEVGRKNTKSTIGATLIIYSFLFEGENGPQVKTAATTGQQARIVFNIARKMIEKSPDLKELFDLRCGSNSIASFANDGTLMPMNAKASTQDGLNPHCYILDELHAHTDSGLFNVLRTAQGARKNALRLYITTAGFDVNGICYAQRKLVCNILEGRFQMDHYFGIIYTLDEPKQEVKDLKKWIKANPMMGISVRKEELKESYDEAKDNATLLNDYLTKRMNVWVNAKNPWLNMHDWEQNDKTYDEDEFVFARRVYGGLDLASTIDIAAFVLIARIRGLIAVKCFFYVPEDVVDERTNKGELPYQQWVNDGYMTATPGAVIDTEYIEEDIRAILDKYNIESIGYDPWKSQDLVNRLEQDSAPMIQVRQGPRSYNMPMMKLDALVKQGSIAHNNNPVLTWMAGNLVARKDVNQNLAPDKQRSLEKIDGMVALLEALYGLLFAEDKAESNYDKRGLAVID